MPLGAFKLNAISKNLIPAVVARTAATISGSRTNVTGKFSNGHSSIGGFTVAINQTPTTIGSGNAGTVEFWVYRPSASASDTNIRGLMQFGNSLGMSWYSDRLYFENTSFADFGNMVFSTNTWYHIVLQTSGNGTWQTYMNGIRKYNAGISTNFNSVICLPEGASNKQYRIDEIRISKIARYTGTSLTIPTAPFTNDADTLALFHCNSTSEVDDRS